MALARTASPDETDFDIVSPAFHENPFPTLERMRAAGQLVRMKLPIFGRTWLALTHETCSILLKDHERFVRDPANAGKYTQRRIFAVMPRTISLLALNMLSVDDPDHRRLRGLVDQAFQRRSIEALRPLIVSVADRLLDRLEGKQEAELMAAYCRELPLAVICEVLGLPEKDHDRFADWLGGLKDTANIGAVVKAIPSVFRVLRYLRAVSRPGSGVRPDGLIAALMAAEHEGHRLSEDEMVSMIFLLFGAGQETTTHLIGGGLLALLSDWDQRGRLMADPSLMPTCVEECLRYFSPVQLTKPRYAVVDTELGGVSIRRGDVIAGMLAAANCDPAKFDRPEKFDIGRKPNPHIGFGTGVHFCLGFQLARAEAAIAFERLFARFPSVRLAIRPQDIVWRKRLGIRAMAELPVRLAS